MALTQCPSCSKEVSTEAFFCPHCGHPFKTPPPERKWSPGVAAVLSLVIPGAGQIYKGQILRGLVWLFVVVLGYFLFIIPGVILHIVCIVGATSGNPTKTLLDDAAEKGTPF